MLSIGINKWKKLFIFLFLLVVFFFILGQLLHERNRKKGSREWRKTKEIPLIIWWTPLLAGYEDTRICDKYFCHFTTSREGIKNAKVSVQI